MSVNPAALLRDHLDRQSTARDLAFPTAELRGIDLSGLRADGVNLDEADLRHSHLQSAHWKNSTLREARLEASDWREAILRRCDLDGTRASGATFVRARMENCTARSARFDGADLTEAVLTDTDFSRASLHGANLEGVEASGANFRGADLRRANLRNAVLIDSDLRGADFTDADLTGADLRGADLRGVVGDDVARPKEEAEAIVELPLELKALSGTLAPIVAEVLRTAGRRGIIDVETTARLTEEVAALRQVTSPKNAPHEDTVKAVSRVLEELGDDIVPKLFAALSQPNQKGPPAEVLAMIRRLSRELSLNESATAEDVLERLMKGS